MFNLFKKNKIKTYKECKNYEDFIERLRFIKIKIAQDDTLNFDRELVNIHKKLMNFLIEELNKKNYSFCLDLLYNKYINKKSLINEEGQDLVLYILYNNKNEDFIYFYKENIDSISNYITQPFILFTIILNKKNFELIEFFLKDENLSSSLKKENITNCLYVLIQDNKKELITYLTDNFSRLLDARSIEASLLYIISHKQEKELKLFFSFPQLTSTFEEKNLNKIIGLSILQQNENSLELITKNENCINLLENTNSGIINDIIQFSYKKNNNTIINNLCNSSLLLKGRMEDILLLNK